MSMAGQQNEGIDKRTFAQLIMGEYDYSRPRRGQFYDAMLLEIDENSLIVDLGAKRDGIVPPKDLEILDDEPYLKDLNVGDQIPVVVLNMQGREDEVVVSLNKG